MKKYLDLFFTFFKIGAFTFGGGYSMIPIIEKEMVINKKWISKEDVLDIFAISNSAPGAIAINCSTFIGYKIAGFWGAFVSTIALIIPSFVIILIVSYFLKIFENNLYVKYAFWGIKIGVVSLILKALISMIGACPKNILTYLIMAAAFICSVFFSGINAIYIVVASALIGIACALISKKSKGGNQ